MRRLTITLKEPARTQAELALTQRGLLATSEVFRGPVFEGWVYWKMVDGFVKVDTYTNESDFEDEVGALAVYYYPVADVARLKWEFKAS